MDDEGLSQVLRECGTIQRGKLIARVDRVEEAGVVLAEMEAWVYAHRGRRRLVNVPVSGLRADRVLEPAGNGVSVFEVPIAELDNARRR